MLRDTKLERPDWGSFGHVQRRDREYTGRRTLKMRVSGRRQRADSWMWQERICRRTIRCGDSEKCKAERGRR